MYDEHEELRRMVRKLADRELRPMVRDLDAKGAFSDEVVRILQQGDILGMAISPEFGGTGLNCTAQCVVMEELGKVFPSAAVMLSGTVSAGCMLLAGGHEEVKTKYLPDLAAGRILGAFCMTEPDGGSDAAGIRTRAVMQSTGDYLLNGRKCFITNGGVAKVHIVMVVTDPSKGKQGISAFLVDSAMPGVVPGTKEDLLGCRCADTREVSYENVILPAFHLLGREGEGLKLALTHQNIIRTIDGAACVGIAAGALEHAVTYAKERIQFKQRIIEFQAIQFMLADMAMKVEAARALVYKAADIVDRGEMDSRYLASIAKCVASDVAMEVTPQAIQILGAYGYSKAYPVEMLFRDAKAYQIFSGTNQIQRIVIARCLTHE